MTKKKDKGCSTGSHHETSPIARGTQTPNKLQKIRKLERKGRGWGD